MKGQYSLKVAGQALSILDVCAIGIADNPVQLETDSELHSRMSASVALVEKAVADQQEIYGVTTGFGGMAGVSIPQELAVASQRNLISFLATGAGSAIDHRHVRVAMLLRANVLARGCSGVRFEVVDRLIHFLNVNATPVVRELGSIGASGDLVPLSTIARAITGLSDFINVQFKDRIVEGSEILKELGFEPLELQPKEGLAIVNGTSFSSAIAANCVYETRHLMALAMGVQCMMMQAMLVQEEPFEDFVHENKPHPGQMWTAKMMRRLFSEGRSHGREQSAQVQDRYSMRCFPQYMGPIAEGLARIEKIVETEMNAVSDNPLVDTDKERFYQSGNFLGQYVGMAMDDLRKYLGLMAKHLDVQIASLVSPEYSNGLPASLRGNESISYNMGLKGLQITGNSIMPMLTWYGHPIVDQFPTHAEQFNQNINSLSWGSANLAWKSVDLFQHYLAVSMIFAIQALDLRAKSSLGHYDGRALLGELTVPLYESICNAMNCQPQESRPFLFDDQQQWLERQLEKVQQNISTRGSIVESIEPILESFDESFD